ncbi:MAG: group II intron maturase-specific domain-containing protein [Candidatus Paceibacterota bacterium]
MANINQLPYFQVNNTKETNIMARFLLKKLKKLLRETHPYHYLIFARQDKRLEYIQKMSKKYKYFLKLDIEKYYPSINHKILLEILEKEVFKNNLSRRLKYIIRKELPLFLKQSPTNNYGLSLGNYLSWVLTGLYLLPLDLKIYPVRNKISNGVPRPFLRVQDDYLIFCKSKKEPEKILKEIIEPELEKLDLKININKLNSGKFHENPVEFMGFRYYAGIFTISEKKLEEFKNRIIKITHLTNKKSEKAIIKLLNNKILGFGNYYKFASCKQDFEKLDAFIRQRLRRYISRNKDSKNKSENLILTNKTLESMGLKSLEAIYNKYASTPYRNRFLTGQEKRVILKKNKKNSLKIGKLNKQELLLKSRLINDEYWKKTVLEKLQELTKNVRQIKNKIDKIEKKLGGKDKSKN